MEMPLHRPVPRRNFEITPASTESSHPPSPAPEQHSPEYLSDRRTDMTPQKTRSILNLTSSTLFGIYSGTSESGGLESSTPWGTGAQTPNIRKSMDGQMPEEPRLMWSERSNRPMSMSQARPKRIGLKGYYVPLAIQTVLLFAFGTGYGLIVTQLHKSQQITPVPVPGADRHASYYHISWGLFGILVGNGLPLVDSWLDESAVVDADPKPGHRRTASSSSDHDRDSLGPMWYSAVRSVGAFVGIAFAVRKLPWQSTLQVSSTLALANPVLWYLIDRSTPGFAFSTLLSIVGTIALSVMSPNFVPVPAIHQAVASDQVGVYMWLASILFCTSLCFGAIGRKLQL